MKLAYNDEQHAYWLDGRRCKSVSAAAKIPDDGYALDQWRKRQICIGLAGSPALVERAAAYHDDRDQLDRIAEDAMKAAKAHESADRGTVAHLITERHDLDRHVISTPFSDVVSDSWERALEAAGVDTVLQLVERIVVYPERHVAGRFDRIVRERGTGRLMILDLKTGANAVRYPHAMATQLALYANAPLMAGPLEGSGSTEQFGPLPELDRDWGLIVHMPFDAPVQVHEVNIAAGWETVERVIWPTLEWRARRDLVRERRAVPG